MLPSRVMYKGKIFETIGLIKLNNGSFLILKNDSEILNLDLTKVDGLSLDLKFEVKEPTKVEIIFIDYIMASLKNAIKNGKYKDKQELITDINSINRYINTHSELLANIKELDFKNNIVDKNILQLLTYFDEVMNDTPLDLENVTSFEIEGKGYIKFKDENGKVRILDDNADNRNFKQQFQSRQNESLEFQTDDGKKNTLEIAEDIAKFQKKEVALESTVLNNSFPNNWVNESVDANQVLGNEKEKIFYNNDDDQILTISKKDNQLSLKEVEQTKAENTDEGSKIIYPSYDEVMVTKLLAKGKKTLNIDAFLNSYLSYLTDEQIDYMISNYKLTDYQITMLNEQKAANIQKEDKSKKTLEKPKMLVLKKEKAAFIDTLLLSFIVGLVWGIYLTFLIFLILS